MYFCVHDFLFFFLKLKHKCIKYIFETVSLKSIPYRNVINECCNDWVSIYTSTVSFNLTVVYLFFNTKNYNINR